MEGICRQDIREKRFQQSRDGGLAEPPQSQRRDRDPQRRDREVLVEVVECIPEELGPGAPFRDELIDRGATDADVRELRGDEESVQPHQDERGEHLTPRDRELDHAPPPRCENRSDRCIPGLAPVGA